MTWPTERELEVLVDRFRTRTLSKIEWTHQAHLAVGLWHVFTLGAEAALPLLREGITRLNEAHGTANTDAGGYHETITRAYVTLTAAFLARRPVDATAAEHVHALLDEPLARRDALFEYYSKEVLFSVAARRGWVEPDGRPFIDPSRAPARS